jgi:hypothetical protein
LASILVAEDVDVGELPELLMVAPKFELIWTPSSGDGVANIEITVVATTNLIKKPLPLHFFPKDDSGMRLRLIDDWNRIGNL